MGRPKKEKEPKICPICGKEYNSPWKTCSKECGHRAKGLKLSEKFRIEREKKLHFCLQCGKLIEPWKKFCNKSCAATYNNLKRGKGTIHWSEEKKLAVRVPRVKQYCKYCGKETGNYVREGYDQHKGCCSSCKHNSNVLREGRLKHALEALPLHSSEFKESFREAESFLKHEYLEKGKSMLRIATELGVWSSSIYMLLRKMNIPIRSAGESFSLGLEKGYFNLVEGKSNRYKCGTFTTWQNKRVHYRSSYELKYIEELEEKKIPYSVEEIRIKYFDTQKNKERVAVPDFYLPETNELVEIKSKWTYNEQNMRDKFKAYKEAGYKPKLYLDFKEINLGS